MEKKYSVIVYRNLYTTNTYVQFTDKQKAENYYKNMLNIAKEQKEEDQDKPYYILDVKLYTTTKLK